VRRKASWNGPTHAIASHPTRAACCRCSGGPTGADALEGEAIVRNCFARLLLHVATGGELQRLQGAATVHISGPSVATCHAAAHAIGFCPRWLLASDPSCLTSRWRTPRESYHRHQDTLRSSRRRREGCCKLVQLGGRQGLLSFWSKPRSCLTATSMQ
jgi:hypothetical protein